MQPSKEQSIRSKLGSILGIGSSRTASVPQRNLEDLGKLEHSTFFTADFLRELDCNMPLQRRVRALRENMEVVKQNRLEEHAVEAIWMAIKDMIEPSQASDVRQATLDFIRNLIYGQFEDLGVLRAHFMNVVKNHNVMEDASQRFEILYVLTQNGKNIHHLEESIGPFLRSWMPEIVTLGHSKAFLTLLINLVHFSAAYLDGDVLVGVVRTTCILAGRSQDPDILVLCLDFINAVVCYSSLPSECLVDIVTTLCQMLNIEKMAKQCLEVMLKLLGTHLGRSAIYTMCTILQEKSGETSAYLLRGAVFFVSMSLWGIRKVESLDVTFASVLPSIRQSVLSHQTLVVFEAALSLRRLVQTYGRQLHLLEWDSIYDIMHGIQDHLHMLKDSSGQDILSPKNTLGQCQLDLFLAIEDCYDGGRGCSIGEPDKFFDLVEDNFDALPLKSVLNLVSYRTSSINYGGLGLVEKVVKLMEKFYVREMRSAVRIEVLNYLSRLMDEASSPYEGRLMEGVIQEYLECVAADPDVDVRCRAAQLLVQLLTRSSPKWSTLVLALINSILQHGLGLASRQVIEPLDLLDSQTVVFGLTQAFKDKLQSSSPVSAQILSMLVVLLQQHYDEGYFFPAACKMRTKIFGCILSVRSNDNYQIGFQYEDTVTYTPFYVCRQSGRASDQESKASPMLLDYRSTFAAVLACLEKECDWEVLSQVLEQLRKLLQDRVLTLSAQPDLSPLCLLLCSLVGGQNPRLRTLRTTATVRPRADPSSLVFPVLMTLATYPSHLDRRAQHSLVFCLNSGLVGSSAQLCVSSLTLCSLELQATMVHLLPQILLRMSQVAATPTMALPVLEFLSNLVPVPALYSGFVDQEYLSVVAIALPYTNHQKYTNYVVAMAHRVIAQWFVNCKMHHRPAVANFVCKILANNLEENLCFQSSPGKSVQGARSDGSFGTDMIEVCMDVMARYTYSSLSSMPSRNSGSSFLVSGGPSKTWLLGNSLVTITTSVAQDTLCKFCLSSKDKRSKPDTHTPPMPSLSHYLEACTCQSNGWAEIKIRRPAGNTGWMMHLQNRPHPLSITHPSAYTVAENEMSLLSASLPAEARLTTVEEAEKEDIFYSREVGSFTDISFLSSFSGKLNGAESRKATSSENNAKKIATGGSEQLQAKGGSEGHGSIKHMVENAVVENIQSTVEPLESLKEVQSESILKDTLESNIEEESANETSDQESIQTEIKVVEEAPRDASSTGTTHSDVTALPFHMKRPANSQSWSESDESSSVKILTTPRASSLSYAMEHLPPLFSYDEGDEFSRSPSLHQGVQEISDKEQISLHASVNDILSKEASSDTDEESSESGSTEMSETLDDVSFDITEEVQSDEREMVDVSIVVTEGEEIDGAEAEEKPEKAPRLKKKSLSLPEQKSNPLPTAAVMAGGVVATARGAVAAVNQQPFTVNRRQSAPPLSATSPSQGVNADPSVSRKKLIYTQRPLSASKGSGDTANVVSGCAHRREEDYDNPSFIFLQLFNSKYLGDQTDLPILVPANDTTDRAIKVLDHIPPYETHKLGIVYVKNGQTTELQILSNTSGSLRYLDFLRGLGPIMKLSDVPPDEIYLGGLDRSGTDGDFTYCFHDDITQIAYHVATMMPSNLKADPSCSNKKLHIGNDFVTIVYNDSGAEYKFGTIKGQFNYVEVVIEPLLEGVNQVSLHAKPGLEGMLQMSPVCVSDSCLPILVRQKALQANLASISCASVSASGTGSSFDCNLSNWLARLHHIRKIQEKCRRDDPPSHLTSSGSGGRAPKMPEADRGGVLHGHGCITISNFTNFS